MAQANLPASVLPDRDRSNAAWDALHRHREADGARLTNLRALFADDPDRAAQMNADACGIYLDYSKSLMTAETLTHLLALAEAARVEPLREAMFAGAHINTTENRAVRHVALRAPRGTGQFADVEQDVHDTRERFLAFADKVRSGTVRGATGEAFTDVVNIGIGGSDLGPLFATHALAPYHDGPKLHFVSNVDGAHIADTLNGLDPARTLFLVASKSFTTLETMMNAATARRWIAAQLGEAAVGDHFAAISTNLQATKDFGVPFDRVFGFWDWVGGRYSVWSAIGLPLAIAIGPDDFRAFLAGAHDMDRHFQTAPGKTNLPKLLGLIGVWNRNLLAMPGLAVLPYDQRLARLPAYLQQLEMESNGKSVTREGAPVQYDTAPVVFGEPGTNGQHAFYQMLHQGTLKVPCDFLIAANAHEDQAMADHHIQLVANCLAQSQAMAFGQTEDQAKAALIAAGMSATEAAGLAPHKVFPGNRPSVTILYDVLDPATLGKLIALYEHKIFVQAAVWGINAFDQWGVELGKVLAKDLTPVLNGAPAPETLDGSTAALVERWRALRSA